MGNKYKIYFCKVKKCKVNNNLHKKTHEWSIRKDSEYALAEYLGLVKWNGAWRRYAFYPDNDTFWDQSCLVEVSAFLIKVNREWRQQRAK